MRTSDAVETQLVVEEVQVVRKGKERGKGPGSIFSGILRFMPRRPRIHLAGVPLHSVQGGHNRDACFFGEDDSLAYPHGLGEALKESGCVLHAHVLMTNPVHWLLTPPQPQEVPRLIISPGRGYVGYINKTYHRTGTLWDSCYTSSLVQEDIY
jgi:putative transposase